MTFDEVLEQVRELLQRKGRVAYRALKRRFQLDDEYLEDLKAELIDAEHVACDEDGKVLVWVGNSSLESEQVQGPKSKVQSQEALPLDSRLRDSRRDAAERRQLTVMFCDLVGSTALSEQLDPEEWREVVRTYHQVSGEMISRYAGYTAQHLGDGLLVYFGYPAAHEDDAQRAVRAGLEIVEAIRGQVTGDGGQARRKPLQVRIGIHTGLVVIGEIGSSEKREILALGETPNIAARVQGQAEPNEVVISAATYRLVEGLFECEDRGQPALKGVSTPLTLYRVVKAGEAQSRFQVVARKGLTPLVGREHEFGLLCERWARVKDGEGQAVLLSGEPGIGKSRLVEALKDSLRREGVSCLELRCSPYSQNSALQPVIEHLQRRLHFRPEDAPESKLEKLRQTFSRYRFPQADTLPLFAVLLALPHPTDYPLLSLSPQRQKEKTHEAVVAWLCAEAKQQAVTYAWEDLHWADPSTLELLTLFLEQVPTTRVLAVLTFRPEFTPPWGSHFYLSQLILSRLSRTQVELMVEKVTGGRALPAEVVQQIARKTDGVPLFVEELTKTVLESIGSAIPATLQDSLMARIDRLGAAKEVAQLGAMLGREFNYELLRVVSSVDEAALQHGLRQLVEAELVYQSGVPPQATYLFKHALVQDTAYQSLLKSTRQQYHQQIARVLEEQFPKTKEVQPELVAHHYTEAGLIAQALPYWQQAGERAIERSANVEAINHLTKELELLKTLPDTPQRAQQELALQTTLGPVLIATKGNAALVVEEAYTRARELCWQLGETPQLFPVLFGLRSFYLVRAELQTAHELGEQLLLLAQSVQDSDLLLEAHVALANTFFFLGEVAPAREHAEQGISLYDSQKHRSHAFLYGLDPGVFCLSRAAHALWLVGYPDQALKKNQAAVTQARGVPHPSGLAYALGNAAWFHQFRREGRAAQERAEEQIALSTEQRFPFLLAWGMILRGWALAEQGQGEEGVAQTHQGLAASRVTGAEAVRPYLLTLLAEAYGGRGQAEEGLKVLAEALEAEHKGGEHYYEAERYRLKGELVLLSKTSLGQVKDKSRASQNKSAVTDPQSLTPDPQGEAEACFLKAIDIARRQSAKSLELRAVMSVSRLWQQQGKKKQAHKMLSSIYNWFTEGFDTKDLQEAKTLLGELS
jgi:class 3 adenylate cyclase/predicted ATPase